MKSDASMRVSNRGGYQSFPNMFIAGSQENVEEHRRACRALHLVVSAAMDEMRAGAHASFPGCSNDADAIPGSSHRGLGLYPADAWINVNRPVPLSRTALER